MPKEKTLEEKLEEASSAVERALEARDKAIQDLMEKAKMAYGEVWRKLRDKSKAPVPDEKDEKTALRKVQRAEAEPPTDGTNPPLEEKRT
jgi:hypothetical protein